MNQSSVSDSQTKEIQTDLTPCFDTQKEWFEHTVKSTSKYQNLVFTHGERLFIMENGQYKIAAVQLAWEIHQDQQKQIDELKRQIDALQVLIQKWRDNPHSYADLNVWECVVRIDQAIRGEA